MNNNNMKNLNFDELVDFIKSIESPTQRLGIFNVSINNKGKKYEFINLKPTHTNNKDFCGFSLNHYGWLNLPMPKYKKSKFHDEEDVSVWFERVEFISATLEGKLLKIKTKNFNTIITW